MFVDIVNEYGDRVFKGYDEVIKNVCESVLDYTECPYECMVGFTITDDKTIRNLNKEQREINKATDVLSFPMIEYEKEADFSGIENDPFAFDPDTGRLILGDIVISYDHVMEQAKEYNHSIKREFAFLAAHGMFHLMGYDHIKEKDRMLMEKAQNTVLSKLNITREEVWQSEQR